MQEIHCGVCGRTMFVEGSAPPSCPSCGAPLPAVTPTAPAEPEPVAEAVPAEEIPATPHYASAAPETATPVETSAAAAAEPTPEAVAPDVTVPDVAAPAAQHAVSVAVAEAPDAPVEAEVVAEVRHDESGADNGVAWFVTGIIFLLIAIAATGWILWLQYIPL